MNADYPSTKSQPKLTAADYHGTSIQLIEKDGSRWLTARDLGLCLGYSEANARQGIINLYNRHVDEFTEKDSCEIKLISQGQERNTRIFSPSGCHLLSFFANTGRAKDFRAWAKEVLVQAGARKFPPTPCLRRLFVHNARRGVENLVTSGLPHPTLWFFYARTGDPAMPGGQRIQYPQGELSRLTSYSFRTPRHPINRDSSKKLTRSQS